MAYESGLVIVGTKTAGADYSSSGYLYTCVKTTAAANVTEQVTGGGVVMGVLQNRPASGQAAAVAVSGVTKVRTGQASNIQFFSKLVASTGGGVTVWTTASQYVLGRSLDNSTSANVLITMLITHQGAGSTEAAGAG